MLTPAQFEGVRQKALGYLYRHQHEGRGPACTACLRSGGTHSGKEQPVCLTVEELLAELKELVDETDDMDVDKLQVALELALPVLRGNTDEALRKAALDAALACADKPAAPEPTKMAAPGQVVGFQFILAYVDQHGRIRSIMVTGAKDEADAQKKGMEQLLNSLRGELPAPVTRAMSLKIAYMERGEFTPLGWVPDRDWRNRR